MSEFPPRLTPDDSSFVDSIEQALMGAPRRFKRAEVSEEAGVDPQETRRVWRSLGWANARDADVVFTEKDVEALRYTAEIVARQDLDIDTLLGLARALGRTTDRLAMWQTQLVADLVAGRQDAPEDGKELARQVAEETVALSRHIEPLLLYVYRRNLGVTVARLMADAQPESHLGVVRTVGFADLVSFTRLSGTLSERDLAALVTRFESMASDIVSENGGAVVKTVGDEILFTHQDPAGASSIARGLRAVSEVDDVMPQLRVGMATGRVLARLGDIYGPTVNRAARLTSATVGGQILIDEATADALRRDPNSALRANGSVDLAGIGDVETWVLS